MTIRELYDIIDGNYDQAVRVMKSEKLIDKYVRKLKNSHLDDMMEEAYGTMDAARLFESAHAMKGVCSNLGLDALARAADEITEEFRPGNPRRLSDEEALIKLRATVERYRAAVAGIEQYEAGC